MDVYEKPTGMSWWLLGFFVLRELLEQVKTGGLTIQSALEALSGIARRRKDAAEGTTWDPARPLLEGR